jgi:hypothetical protein
VVWPSRPIPSPGAACWRWSADATQRRAARRAPRGSRSCRCAPRAAGIDLLGTGQGLIDPRGQPRRPLPAYRSSSVSFVSSRRLFSFTLRCRNLVPLIRTNLTAAYQHLQDLRRGVPRDPDVAEDAVRAGIERSERDRLQILASIPLRSDEGSSEISARSVCRPDGVSIRPLIWR